MEILQCKKLLKNITFVIGITIILAYVLFIISVYVYSYYNSINNQNDTHIIVHKKYENVLIDLKDFRFLMDNDMCNKTDINILGILLVPSYVGHEELRFAHRNAISQEKLKELRFLRIFLTAVYPYSDPFADNELILEQEMFNDIIQGNFMDTYRNLSYKIIMGFKWAATKCSNAQYIIKVDDDIVFDIYYMMNFLENFHIKLKNATKFIAGSIDYYKSKPVREKSHIFYTTYAQYKKDKYPYFTYGLLYITNPKTAKILVNVAKTTKYIGIEDTFITGILRYKARIQLYDMTKIYSVSAMHCCLEMLKEHGYKCEYYIGLNYADIELFEEYLKETKKCDFKKCINRPTEFELTELCPIAKTKSYIRSSDY